jgi:hypothetical protein
MIPFVCTLSGAANSPDIEIGVADEDGYITWIGHVYLPLAFDSDQEVLFHGYTTDVEPFSTTLAHPRELTIAACNWAVLNGLLEPEHLRGLEAVQRAEHIRFAQRPGTSFPWSEYKDSFERSPS